MKNDLIKKKRNFSASLGYHKAGHRAESLLTVQWICCFLMAKCKINAKLGALAFKHNQIESGFCSLAALSESSFLIEDLFLSKSSKSCVAKEQE